MQWFTILGFINLFLSTFENLFFFFWNTKQDLLTWVIIVQYLLRGVHYHYLFFLHFSIVDVSLHWFPTNKKNPKQIIFFRILEENTFFTWIVVQVQVVFKSISVELSGVQHKSENDFELWAATNIQMCHLTIFFSGKTI